MHLFLPKNHHGKLLQASRDNNSRISLTYEDIFLKNVIITDIEHIGFFLLFLKFNIIIPIIEYF